jgi:Zn-dependent peptidase ImmA (M78 family)/transcriptional regulator with XRE-family HTH domain
MRRNKIEYGEKMTTPAFQRARLRLARELMGWSQAQLATKLKVTPAALSQFESGSTRPSTDTVARLSTILRVPVDFFSEPLTETHEGFFRSLRRTSVTDRRKARAIGYVAHDLASHARSAGQFTTLSIPHLPAPGLDAAPNDVEDLAAILRASWQLPPGPVPDVVELLESHGIAVIRLPLGSIDVDAFSLPFPDHPVVVLGTDKNDRARSRFDAAHELGHLAMHRDQIWGLPEIEKQAHVFAAAFLMPAGDIRQALPDTVDWPKLFDLKRRWQVSLAALLMRAKTLGRMNEATYLAAVKAASARGWRKVEPVPLGPPEQPRQLLTYMGSLHGNSAKPHLPIHIVDSIAAATAAG